eukprot:scaffold356096_cov20-Prasinocladus_malaysianus.AAC.1
MSLHHHVRPRHVFTVLSGSGFVQALALQPNDLSGPCLLSVSLCVRSPAWPVQGILAMGQSILWASNDED